MDNPFALVLTLLLAAVVMAGAIGVLSRLFPSPSPPPPSAVREKGRSTSEEGKEGDGDKERSLSC